MSANAPRSAATGVLGPQLRALRRARGMTLDALAAVAQLDKGYLSRLERGQKAASIATVLRLSAALGVPVGELFGEQLAADSIRVTRANRRLRHAGIGFEGLTPKGGALEAFIVHPGPSFGEDAHEHDGEELLFVLAGRIELGFADRVLALGPGDCAQFPGHLPHRLRRIGATSATALVTVARGHR